jgi:hypothetical protein
MEYCGGTGTLDDPYLSCNDGFGGPPAGFEQTSNVIGAAAGIQALIGIAVVVGIIVAIVFLVRNSKRAIDHGHNPLTVDYDLKLAALDRLSETPAAHGTRSNADRLAELAALLAAGSITQAEHDDARARILSDL